MPRHTYRERDHAFGQAMFKLRTSIGLTQISLAALLGVSRRAIGEWEAGSNYPKSPHLQHFLELCVQQHAFAPEREGAEIRVLWKIAHQRVLLDEAWLAGVLTRTSTSPAQLDEAGDAAVVTAPPASSISVAQTSHPGHNSLPVGSRAPSARGPRLDWGNALDVPSLYGREQELSTLAHWVVQERCRLVSVLGLGVGPGGQPDAPGRCALRGGALALPQGCPLQ